jgi:hypothetical protein
VMFSALATISYDDSSHTYRFRAYNDGHYVDTELSVPPNGFSWSLTTGAGTCCEQHAPDRERRVGRSHRSDGWQQSWESHREDVTATFAVGERSPVSKSSERNASTGHVARSRGGINGAESASLSSEFCEYHLSVVGAWLPANLLQSVGNDPCCHA